MTSALDQLSDFEWRLCLFVSLLDDDVAERVVETFPPARRQEMLACVREMAASPPHIEQIESVIEEFDRMLRLLKSVKADSTSTEQDESKEQQDPDGAADAGEPEAAPAADLSQVSGAVEQLSLLAPQRLAAALRDEQPQIVAIVAKQLTEKRAGEMLAFLPGDLRSAVMLKLTAPIDPAPRLVEQLLAATIRRAVELDPKDLKMPRPAEERMARVLRSMSRKQRMETLDKLAEEDPELAEAVQKNMFSFEDLLQLDDRSVKALLSEIETESLSLALKGADQVYIDCIVRNLSRRAGGAFSEELEFMSPPSDDAQENARQRIVHVMCKLDQDGALNMKEP